MKKEPVQNPIITIALIHFVVVILILRYVQAYTVGTLLPQLASGATPSFSLWTKILIPVGFVIDLPVSLMGSHFFLSGLTLYVAEALSGLLWGWVIVWAYRKLRNRKTHPDTTQA